MDIFDSNIIIYAVKDKAPAEIKAMLAVVPAYSRISEVEIFGYPKITSEEIAALKNVIKEMFIEEITAEVVEGAIRLRQQKRISVPDSRIAAIALLRKYRLVTRNLSDFDWIDGLEVYNPFDDPPHS